MFKSIIYKINKIFYIKKYDREDYTSKKSDIKFFSNGKIINLKDLKI